MKTRDKILLVVFAIVTLAGCRASFAVNNAQIDSPQTKTKVLYYCNNEGIVRLDSSNSGSRNMKMSSENEYYVFYAAKRGYRSRTMVVTPQLANPSRILGGVIGGGAAILGILYLKEGAVGEGGLFFAGGLIVLGKSIIGGPNSLNRNYAKFYELPELKKYATRDKDYPYLYIDTVAVKIPGKIFSHNNYDSYRNYEKGIKSTYNLQDTTAFVFDLSSKNKNDLNLDMNADLYLNGYFDTTKYIYKNDFKYLRMRFSFTSIEITRIDKIAKANADVNIEIFDFIDRSPKLVYNTKAESIWLPRATGYDGFKGELLSDVCSDAAFKFFADEQMRVKMKELGKKTVEEDIKEEEIVLDTSYSAKQKLSEAAQAVFTIVTPRGHGSACLISPDGYMLTNYHVVLNDTTKCRVMMGENEKIHYKIIRLNPIHDLALIKVDKRFDKVLSIGNNDADLGDEVFAIGTPGDVDLGQSISKGIVSSFRSFEGRKYIQTDVKINPGNSGGALLNDSGQLVGIVSAKIVGMGTEGLGFAIPMNEAMQRLKLIFK